jgi:hypothetical protein
MVRRYLPLLVCLQLLSTALARPAWADELPTQETIAAAAKTGLDPIQLQGAFNTLSLKTDEQQTGYLYDIGALERPKPPEPVLASYGTWVRVAGCETGGNWAANTGNGYFGGVQFDAPSWEKAGGLKYAGRADWATPVQQMIVADRWLAMTSWGRSWPACSARLGLR